MSLEYGDYLHVILGKLAVIMDNMKKWESVAHKSYKWSLKQINSGTMKVKWRALLILQLNLLLVNTHQFSFVEYGLFITTKMCLILSSSITSIFGSMALVLSSWHFLNAVLTLLASLLIITISTFLNHFVT